MESTEENFVEVIYEDLLEMGELQPRSENAEEAAAAKKSSDEDLIFTSLLKKHGCSLLEKSQAPNAKIRKKQAIQTLIPLLSEKGFDYSEIQVKKKVENMKARLKKKIDGKKTGNEKIILKASDKILMDILDGQENPSISRLAFGTTLGDKPNVTAKPVMPDSLQKTFCINSATSPTKKPTAAVKMTEPKFEMQTALYTKQMEVFNMQQQLLEIQIKYYTAKLKKCNKENE